jgi:hypothetical protein
MKKVLKTMATMMAIATFAVVLVSCDKDDPEVKEVAVTSVTVTPATLSLKVGGEGTLTATVAPADATDKTVTWSISNETVVEVDASTGEVTAKSLGEATITATTANDITATCVVSVLEEVLLSKDGWEVLAASSEQVEDGGGKGMLINGNYENDFWHTQWLGSFPDLPHWAIIDMKVSVKISKIATYRRNGGYAKTVQYYVSDNPDLNSLSLDAWTLIAEGEYPDREVPHDLWITAIQDASGRYLLLYTPDSYDSNNCVAFHEIDVYGVVE